MRIENKAFEENIRQDKKELRKYWNRGYGFAMEKNGKIIGYSLITKDEDGWYLMSIAINPEHQGKGLGTILLRETLKCLKDMGAREIYAHLTNPAIEGVCRETNE